MQKVHDLLTMYLRPGDGDQEFRHRDRGLLVATHRKGRTSPLFHLLLGGQTTRCSPMDSLAVSHPYTDGLLQEETLHSEVRY